MLGLVDPLLQAINSKKVEHVIKILREENMAPQRLRTALCRAVKSNDPSSALIVAALLTAKAPLNLFEDEDGSLTSPFADAAASGNVAALQMMLGVGGSPESRRLHPVDTALHKGAHFGHTNVVSLLLDSGMNVNSLGSRNETALMTAVKAKRADIAQLLIDRGADVNIKNIDGKSAVFFVDGDSALASMLINAGANLEMRNQKGDTVLHQAAYNGQLALIKVLISSGLDVNIPASKTLDTPLMSAVKGSKPMCVRHLVSNGANVNAVDSNGISVLHFACSPPSEAPIPAIIQLLLTNGAHIDAKAGVSCSPKTATPLLYAIQHKESASVLVAAGANLEAREAAEGRTALHLAVYNCNYDCAKLLLEAGANAMAVAFNGNTAMHILASKPFRENLSEWIELLLSHGASMNCDSKGLASGFKPLHLLLQQFNFLEDLFGSDGEEALAAFLRAGADAEVLAAKRTGMLHSLIENFRKNCCRPPILRTQALVMDLSRFAAALINQLANAGAQPSQDLDGFTPMRRLKHGMGESAFNEHRDALAPVLVALVAAGDAAFDLLPSNMPSPLPGLGSALIGVWRTNPQNLPFLFAKLSVKDQQVVRLLLKFFRFRGQCDAVTVLPEELRYQIISYSLAA